MKNIIEVNYQQTGESTSINNMGMRAMQARAFESRNSQYLLLKAPPASGKSRALMFLGLDKIHNQGLSKVIVTVPERSIGSSFANNKLTENGFFADWDIKPENNLCAASGNKSKVKAFKRFMEGSDQILVCTHATLRFVFEELEDHVFNNTLIAIDEFHHISADADNILGNVLKSLMDNTTAHIIAMTGSYFRGDSVPVITPEYEAKFNKVSFNYYEQLNGYTYLKSLGIGYHFYKGRYFTKDDEGHIALEQVLDTNKKTIIHIPNVNSGESTKDKYDEVDAILEIIGEFIAKDPDTGIITVKRTTDGKLLKVADLVEEDGRDKVLEYLRNIQNIDDLDLIIALGMAKEGFDWQFCEHALTIGCRGSLTEIVQIIGRCTRDSSNKSHAQFTNLIAQPDAQDDEVKYAVNNMLKAITASLLMEQILAPNFKFKTKRDDEDIVSPGILTIKGFKEPSTAKAKAIIENDLVDLKAAILQDDKVIAGSAGKVEPEIVNKVLIPKIIQTKYPDLTKTELEEISQYLVADSVISAAEIKDVGDKKFVRMADKFINIDDLNIDLIQSINPFQKAFEILSKDVTVNVLKLIKESIEATKISMSKEEAFELWPKLKSFKNQFNREPSLESNNLIEKRLAECLIYIREQRRRAGV
ncbi:DEAD/DEAH box helicase [Commensalibacter oyaizuii]|uniref:DEAD/DEAH box helicase n=1 Tax=Commensalibacter oyaizuii TaxID=3043873 RepID=A0ABT6Q2J0_9PROT|nr:DEAD/DEAH box helicase [Commensalibacter sp. TBRC 16381]MDI2091320.1 DEAD/DEAH box helicase [Commensalibacter sp. TBRC 16381]